MNETSSNSDETLQVPWLVICLAAPAGWLPSQNPLASEDLCGGVFLSEILRAVLDLPRDQVNTIGWPPQCLVTVEYADAVPANAVSLIRARLRDLAVERYCSISVYDDREEFFRELFRGENFSADDLLTLGSLNQKTREALQKLNEYSAELAFKTQLLEKDNQSLADYIARLPRDHHQP